MTRMVSYFPIDDVAELRTVLGLISGNRSAYFVTRTGEVVSQDHVHDFLEDYVDAFEEKTFIDRANRLAGWRVNADDFNLICDVTGVRIPSTGGIIE